MKSLSLFLMVFLVGGHAFAKRANPVKGISKTNRMVVRTNGSSKISPNLPATPSIVSARKPSEPSPASEMQVRLKTAAKEEARGLASGPVQPKIIPRDSTDLSSEIEQSKEQAQKAQATWRDKGGVRPKLKRKTQTVISEPVETVEVPDSVDWSHHRDQENTQVEELKDLTKKGVPQRVDE